jgi:hypothetical protein
MTKRTIYEMLAEAGDTSQVVRLNRESGGAGK